jgi:methylated-DNA-[protein]-cysteine S-methyltransferase
LNLERKDGMANHVLFYDSREFPLLGRIYVGATEKGLCHLALPGKSVETFFQNLLGRFKPGFFTQNPAPFQDLYGQIGRYVSGSPINFEVATDLRGTAFQIAVWEALRAIPYGQTRSYGEIARAIGRPRACRAVGQANHRNPIPIVVPCHRVIGAGGDLVGFGSGLPLKERLLSLEGRGSA